MSVDKSGDAQQTVEQKLDVLSASVDKRFNAVDENFKAVTAALVEQREYTEFAFGRLEARLDRMEAPLDRMEARFDRMDAGVDRMDARVDRMDAGVSRLDQRMDTGFGKVDGRFARLERKLDQIIDLHVPKTPPDRSDAE
jgi:predicted nuclease with TOPRIM domain